MDLDNMWKSFLSRIKAQISDIAFDTWFAETKLISLDNNTATVIVPYHIHKKNLSENYNDIIEETFTELTGSIFKFNYLIQEEVENNLAVDTEEMGVPNNDNYESNLDSKYTFESFMGGSSKWYLKIRKNVPELSPGAL